MNELAAPAKVNLALVVGPRRHDGKHELVTVYERLALADTIRLEAGTGLEVAGFPDDTLARTALEAIAQHAGVTPAWHVTIEKRIPVAAGLGGGSSDAAAVLRLANATLDVPLREPELHRVAARIGADVPFFLTEGPQLGEGDGTVLTPLALPRGYHVVLVLPANTAKASTAAVYMAFDERGGDAGFDQRRMELLSRLRGALSLGDLAALPKNDLASSTLVEELERLGAFRADVSGAGPAVYGLFEQDVQAARAASELAAVGRAWVTAPAWYG